MQYVFPLIAIFCWAANTIVTKLAATSIEPSEIGFYRWLFAALLLSPFVLLPTLRNWQAYRPHLGKIFVLGSLGMALFQSLAYFAAAYTSATNMGIIQALMPSLALILAVLMLGQLLTLSTLAGTAISFIGVLLVVSNGQVLQLLKNGLNLGDGLMLIAALSYSLYSTLLKRWQLGIPMLQMLYLQMLVAILVQLPLFLWQPKTGLNAENLPLVLFACFFASIAAPLAWMQGVKLLGPSRTSSFFNLTPLVTLIFAALTLGEQVHLYHWLGGGLIVFGVVLAERWKRVG